MHMFAHGKLNSYLSHHVYRFLSYFFDKHIPQLESNPMLTGDCPL